MSNECDDNSPRTVSNACTALVLAKVSACVTRNVEAVGRWYEVYQHRHHHHRNTLSSSGTHEDNAGVGNDRIDNLSPSSSSETDVDNNDVWIGDGDEQYLVSLDPADWKNQDHYRVLGLSKIRFKATDKDIKKAYRRRVLKHHPDKRQGAGKPVKAGDDDYFAAITKAYDILGNLTKKRSYDSVDPEFDDETPAISENSKKNFFSIFTPVFRSNARWSNHTPVPDLGTDEAPFEDVDNFYSFWYEFDSWREFSYLNEEEKEKGENREERRWIEKQNKQENKEKKKSEVSRIRQLVDNAYQCDPRIQRFRDEKKQKKLAEKQAKKEAVQQRLDEEEKRKREEDEEVQRKKEKEEEEQKVIKEKEKKEKLFHKKQMQKERKTLRTITKDNDYFAGSDDKMRVKKMSDVEKLCNVLELVDLQRVNVDLTLATTTQDKADALNKHVELLDKKIEEENAQLLAASQQSKKNVDDGVGDSGQKKWPEQDLQLLIKAVNLFPAGTADRWVVVSNFINQHSTSNATMNYTAKHCISKAKTLQKSHTDLKEQVNKKAFETFSKSQKTDGHIEEAPSERDENAAWSAEEQKLLEQALKTYPTNVTDRWDRIADTVASRTKKECMQRYKDLVDMVKAKKAAQAAASKTSKVR